MSPLRLSAWLLLCEFLLLTSFSEGVVIVVTRAIIVVADEILVVVDADNFVVIVVIISIFVGIEADDAVDCWCFVSSVVDGVVFIVLLSLLWGSVKLIESGIIFKGE